MTHADALRAELVRATLHVAVPPHDVARGALYAIPRVAAGSGDTVLITHCVAIASVNVCRPSNARASPRGRPPGSMIVQPKRKPVHHVML